MFSDTFFYILIGLLVCSIFLSFFDNRNVEHFSVFSKLKKKAKAKKDAVKNKIKAKKDAVKNKIKAKTDAAKNKIKAKTDAAKNKIKAKTDAAKNKIKAKTDAVKQKAEAKTADARAKIKAKTDAAKQKVNKVNPVQADLMNSNNKNVNRISNMERPKQINKSLSMNMVNTSNNNCACSCSEQNNIMNCSCVCGTDGTPAPTIISTNDVIQQNLDLQKKLANSPTPIPGSNNSLFGNHMKKAAPAAAMGASGQQNINPDRSYKLLEIGDEVKVRMKGKKGAENDTKVHDGKVEQIKYSYQLSKNRKLTTFKNAKPGNLNFSSAPQKNLLIDASNPPNTSDDFYNGKNPPNDNTPCNSSKIIFGGCGETTNIVTSLKDLNKIKTGDHICVCKNKIQESANIIGVSYSAQGSTISEKDNLTPSAFSSYNFDSDDSSTSIIMKA